MSELKLPKRYCELGKLPNDTEYRWVSARQKIQHLNLGEWVDSPTPHFSDVSEEAIQLRTRLAEQADAQDAEERIAKVTPSHPKCLPVQCDNGMEDERPVAAEPKPWDATPLWPRSKGDFVGRSSGDDCEFWLLPNGCCDITCIIDHEETATTIEAAAADMPNWRECAAACREFIAAFQCKGPIRFPHPDPTATIEDRVRLAETSRRCAALEAEKDAITAERNAAIEANREWAKRGIRRRRELDDLRRQLAAKPTLRDTIGMIRDSAKAAGASVCITAGASQVFFGATGRSDATDDEIMAALTLAPQSPKDDAVAAALAYLNRSEYMPRDIYNTLRQSLEAKGANHAE